MIKRFKGTAIHNPGRPRNFIRGGHVTPRPTMTARQLGNDSVLAVLQPGELVVPKKFYTKGKKPIDLAERVAKHLKSNGIKLPHT